MGAWGTGSFENDDAHDWLNDFFDDPNMDAVREALKAVAELTPGEYLEKPECGAAIAAAEVIAALRGAACPDLPEEVAEWVEKHRSRIRITQQLVGVTLRALARVKSDSEMNECWIEEATRQEWQSKLAELELRVAQ